MKWFLLADKEPKNAGVYLVSTYEGFIYETVWTGSSFTQEDLDDKIKYWTYFNYPED